MNNIFFFFFIFYFLLYKMIHDNGTSYLSFGDRDEWRITFFIPLCLVNVIYVRILLLYYIFWKKENVLFSLQPLWTFNLLTEPKQKLLFSLYSFDFSNVPCFILRISTHQQRIHLSYHFSKTSNFSQRSPKNRSIDRQSMITELNWSKIKYRKTIRHLTISLTM